MKRFKLVMAGWVLIYAALSIAMLIGYISCIVKFVKSDFAPIGKREIIYGVGIALPPAGFVIGYLNIDEN